MSYEEVEEEHEIEVMEYKVSPEFLNVMIEATDLLEKIMEGEITVQEARAIYEAKLAPIVESIISTARSAPKKKKKSKAKKTSKSAGKKATKSTKKSSKKKSSSKKSSKSKSKKSKESTPEQ